MALALEKAEAAKAVAVADDLLAGVVAIKDRLAAAMEGDLAAKDVATLAREQRETYRLLLELEGRMKSGNAVNVAIINSPDWADLKGRLLRALEPYPDARAAVVLAIGG